MLIMNLKGEKRSGTKLEGGVELLKHSHLFESKIRKDFICLLEFFHTNILT
jgi:hypothetical protein